MTDRVFHLADDQPFADAGHQPVAEIQRLRKIMAGVDMYQGERKSSRTKGFQRQVHQRDGILAAAE